MAKANFFGLGIARKSGIEYKAGGAGTGHRIASAQRGVYLEYFPNYEQKIVDPELYNRPIQPLLHDWPFVMEQPNIMIESQLAQLAIFFQCIFSDYDYFLSFRLFYKI